MSRVLTGLPDGIGRNQEILGKSKEVLVVVNKERGHDQGGCQRGGRDQREVMTRGVVFVKRPREVLRTRRRSNGRDLKEEVQRWRSKKRGGPD